MDKQELEKRIQSAIENGEALMRPVHPVIVGHEGDVLSFELRCPTCMECNMHHEEVVVYNRKESGSSEATVVNKNSDVVVACHIVSSELNPSSSGTALSITFSCEHCDTMKSLVLSQHKGTTRLWWKDHENSVDHN